MPFDANEGKQLPEEKSLIEMRWYVLGAPWASSRDAGMTVLAGSEDPHAATPIVDTQDLCGDRYDDDQAREIAWHIVELHNASLNHRSKK